SSSSLVLLDDEFASIVQAVKLGRRIFDNLRVLAVFSIALYRGQGELEARALTFTTLVIANLSLIFTNRSWSRTVLATLCSPNAAWWWVVGGALGFLSLVLYVPVLRDLFRFAPLHPGDLLLCLAAGVASILWFEGLKLCGGCQKPSSDQGWQRVTPPA
ncbi:MAG: cation-translocating P-type ATPase, partial [Nitrospinae bacterium]|nr:cation-translocating P-type ATPase [Nitrospinota bacterium]